ncbi:MAG: leucyl/phenylalanyl-tRNA--protein transferase [Gammaproteobacteria bacterium]|nr:leucyl/phenylalanyl-tRNA--protein transferase [Gammaproteobacteria bacterium]
MTANSGLVAIGGDLSPESLINAYSQGIFPWFNSDAEPILWWSPDPRAVVPLVDAEGRPWQGSATGGLHVSRRLRRRLSAGHFDVTADQAFEAVIRGCAVPRKEGDGTWITAAMQHAYAKLHELGLAHSVEVWQQGELVGGVYGVSLGRMFFAESMFSARTDASKAGLARLAEHLVALKFELIDCQIMNRHLESLGARFMPRDEFLARVRHNNSRATDRGPWTLATS